jgi:Fic family protein
MSKLFEDIKILLNSDLSVEEIFYYASQIHLKFVHIHPFSD